METVGLRTENNDCNLSAGYVLLIFDTLIHGEENVEFGGLEKISVVKSCQSRVTGCLTIVAGQRIAESLVDAFVDQNAHLRARE